MEEKDQNRKLVRSTFTVAIPTFISRILGYLRDMLQAFFLGTSTGADAFAMAFVIPNLLRRLTAEGAMTAAFIPVFTQLKNEKSKKEMWRFANCFFYDMTLVMTGIVLLGIIFAPFLVRLIAFGFGDVEGKWELTTLLTRIMFPYIFLVSLAALAMAVLNSFKKFFVPAFTPVLFNLAIITVAGIFARRAEEPAVVFAVGVVVGGLFQLGFQLPFLWRKGMRFKFGLSFTHPAVRKVGRLMVPGIFAVGIYQINFAISRTFASFLKEGSVASLYYASRVQELTLGLFSIALSIALLPTFSELAAQKEVESMKRTLIFSLKLIFFVTLPAMVGLLVLNHPIMEVLFERGVFDAESTAMSASCLFYFALGIPFISGVKIFAPAFYSLKDTKTPVKVAFLVMLSYIGLSLLLMKPLKVGGIALALSLASVLNFAALFYLLERKIGKVKKNEVWLSALKSLLPSAGMGLVVWWFVEQFNFDKLVLLEKLGVLVSAILLGVIIYVLLSLIFNYESLTRLKDIFSKKKILKDRQK